MKIDIIPAESKHLPEISALYHSVTTYLESHINYPGWQTGFYPTCETAQAALQKNGLYIALLDGEIVGSFVLSQAFEEPYEAASWSFPSDYSKIFVVHTFLIHPDYTKQKIGKQMLEYVMALGKAQGMNSIRLDTYEKNLPAMKLYESCGFRFAGKVDLGRADRGLYWYHCYEKVL